MRKNILHKPIKTNELVISNIWKISWNTFFDEQFLHDSNSLLCLTFGEYYIDVSFYFKTDGDDFYFRLEVCDTRKDELGRHENFMFTKDYQDINEIIVDVNYYSNQIPLFERTDKMLVSIPEKWAVSINTLNDKMLRDHQECLFLATVQNVFIDISCTINSFENGIATYNLSVTKPLNDADFNSEILFEKTVDDYFLFEKELNYWLNKF